MLVLESSEGFSPGRNSSGNMVVCGRCYREGLFIFLVVRIMEGEITGLGGIDVVYTCNVWFTFFWFGENPVVYFKRSPK